MAILRKMIILTILLIATVSYAQTYTVERVIDGDAIEQEVEDILNLYSDDEVKEIKRLLPTIAKGTLKDDVFKKLKIGKPLK